MIQLINDNKIISNLENQGYKVIGSPYRRFNQVLAYCKGLTPKMADIIHTVEECKVENNNLISKFTNTPIELNKLSEGTKTVITVYFRAELLPNEKEILDITGCGPNAIKYIMEHYSICNMKFVLRHFELPSNIQVEFMLNNNVLKNTNELYKDIAGGLERVDGE